MKCIFPFSLFDAKVPSSQRSSGFHISDILNLEQSAELKNGLVHHPHHHHHPHSNNSHSATDISSQHPPNTDANSNHLSVGSTVPPSQTSTESGGDHHNSHIASAQTHSALVSQGDAVTAAAVSASAQAQAAAHILASHHNAAAAVAAAGQYLPKGFTNGFNDDMSSYHHMAHTMLTHTGRTAWMKENDLYGKWKFFYLILEKSL